MDVGWLEVEVVKPTLPLLRENGQRGRCVVANLIHSNINTMMHLTASVVVDHRHYSTGLKKKNSSYNQLLDD